MRHTTNIHSDGVVTKVNDDTCTVGLWYPRSNPVKYISIDLVDVRASDGFRTWYDFDRDGWVIEQASKFEWDANDENCDPDWQEVAFVESWKREVKR